MYGSGIGPTTGMGLVGGTLAYTGSQSMVLPVIVAAAALVLGVLLLIRSRRLQHAAT